MPGEKARVFISHSAKEPNASAFLDALEKKLTEAGFTVLLDRLRLKPGDAWRSSINQWIGMCHAAVLLLSEDALKSTYVAYEVSVLSYREKQEAGKFKLIPVLFKPVTRDMLKKEGVVSHASLPEMQLVRPDAVIEADVDAIVKALEACVVGAVPDELHVKRLSSKFGPVEEADVELAIGAVKSPAGGGQWSRWTPGLKVRDRAALAMLEAGLEGSFPALRPIRIRIAPRESWKNPDGPLEETIRLIATGWVPCTARTAIADAAVRKALVHHNARDAMTGKVFLWASCPDAPVIDFFPIAEATAIVGTTVAEVETEVARALAAKLVLSSTDPAAVRDEIADLGIPVFALVMGQNNLDTDVLETLPAKFPGVTFLVLGAPRDVEFPGSVSLPRLPEDDSEARFWAAHEKFSTKLKEGQ